MTLAKVPGNSMEDRIVFPNVDGVGKIGYTFERMKLDSTSHNIQN